MIDQTECGEIFLQFFQHSGEGIILLDSKGMTVATNPSMRKLCGRMEEELVGKNPLEVISLRPAPPSPAPSVPNLQQLVRSDGAVRTVTMSSYIFGGKSGVGSAYLFYDMTRERQAEERKYQCEFAFKFFLKNVDDLVFILDHRLKITKVNPAVGRLFNRKPERFENAKFSSLIHPAMQQALTEQLQGICENPGSDSIEAILQTAEGIPLKASGKIFAARDELSLGAEPMVFVVFEKVSDPSTETEDGSSGGVLEHSLLERLPEGICIADEDQRIRFVNKAACQFLDHKPEEILGRTLESFRAADQTMYMRSRRQLTEKEGNCAFELDISMKDGARRQLMITSTLSEKPDGKVEELMIIRDETERKKAELELVKQFAFTSVLEEIGDVINGDLDEEALFRPVLQAMAMYCEGLHSAIVYRPRQHSPLTSVVNDFSKGPDQPRDAFTFLKQHGQLAHVLDFGEKLTINRVPKTFTFHDHEPMPKWASSFAAVPVILRKETTAVLYVFTSNSGGISRSALLRLEQLAAHCGTVLNNFHLYRQLEEKNKVLSEVLSKLEKSKEFYQSDLHSSLEHLNAVADEIEQNEGQEEAARRINETIRRVRDVAKDIYHI